MSWVALAGTAVLLGTLAAVGCGSPQEVCKTDADCDPAERCHPEAKVCVRHAEDTTCTPGCAEWQYCSRETCYPRYQGITLLEPAAGTVDGGAVVRAQLQAIAPWIPMRPHAKLVYAARGATTGGGDLLPGTEAGAYQGQISLAEGNYQLQVGFPMFPTSAPVSDEVAITVDTTAPAFTVDAGVKTGLRMGGPGVPDDQDPGLGNAFKRTDVVPVTFGTNAADLNVSTVRLDVLGVNSLNQTSFQVSPGGSCGAAQCFTAMVDLATIEMMAMRGQMTIVASGRDGAGNLGQGTVQIPVTRFKWSRTLPSSAAVNASPAVGSLGTVYAATNAGGASTLSAIKPDGTDQWASPVNLGRAFLASPAVGKNDGGTEIVYATPGSSPPILYSFYGSDGSDAGSVSAGSSGSFQASPLVASTNWAVDIARETATTFLNGNALLSLVSLRHGSSNPSTGSLAGAGTVSFPGNVVGTDDIAFVGDDTGRVREYSFSSGGGSWAEAGPVRALSEAPTGLALTQNFIAGASVGSVFAFPRPSGMGVVRTETAPSVPVIVSGDILYSVASNGGTAYRINPTDAGTPVATGTTGGATTSPLLATGQVSYFVRTTVNTLYVLGPNLATLWFDTVEAGVAVASSPNIDCARAANGSKLPGPGTLYYGANNGKLYAIIVDNPGIDTTSPWPKYQHDPRNTGSLSTPLSEFACP